MNSSNIKLSVLTENMASGHFTAEHGLSYFIEYDDKNFLYDTGHSDVFLKNAEKLSIDINKLDAIVLSHGHWDHGNGLKYLKNKKLICHPNAFFKRYNKNDNSYNGLDLSYEELKMQFEIIETREPYHISKNIIFLGEVPRLNSFEAQTAFSVDENNNDDFIIDDSALVMIYKDELIVLAGCAHAGICNIVDYAEKVTGLKSINTVMGGFHLAENNLQTKETIKYFKEKKIRNVIPSHCTQLPALAVFYKEFQFKQVKSGIVYNFE